MKDMRLKLSIIVNLLGLIIIFSVEVYSFKFNKDDGMKVYSNKFTYIVVDSDFSKAQIYEMDPNPHHPVLSRVYWRGDFHFRHIKDDFYSIVNQEWPGKECIDNMDVSYMPLDIGCVNARFRLDNCKDQYVIMARSIRTDSIYRMVYPVEKELNLPIDADGYRFSVSPSESNCDLMAGIYYGFSPTIKYLDLPKMQKDFFSSGGCIDIYFPLFNDWIFDLWCINGDILQMNNQILNEKIVWHGKEFKLSTGIPGTFNQ